jgi:N-acetyl-gamma-glutamyl-phosphate reductase
MNQTKINVAIVGASGYTGSELARILLLHPHVSIKLITSETHAGKPFSALHPQFFKLLDLPLVSADNVENHKDLDFLFLALPHGVSMKFVERWKQSNAKIIDLSGDFRLSSPSVYETWYKKTHTYVQGFELAVYGLPELHKEAIAKSRLVANPGCFPTASILALAPLTANNLIQADSIVIDAKTGVTGAGVKPSEVTHYSNANENFRAYGVKTHRHTIEIEEQLSHLNQTNLQVQFTPHLLPLDRGILTTVYATPAKQIDEESLSEIYTDFYMNEPFVRVKKELPSLKEVRGSNYCDIYPVYDSRTNRIIIFSAIDNLVKGASGAAVQNMNLMAGLKETEGLTTIPLKP